MGRLTGRRTELSEKQRRKFTAKQKLEIVLAGGAEGPPTLEAPAQKRRNFRIALPTANGSWNRKACPASE
jgi:hypothetical protein